MFLVGYDIHGQLQCLNPSKIERIVVDKIKQKHTVYMNDDNVIIEFPGDYVTVLTYVDFYKQEDLD